MWKKIRVFVLLLVLITVVQDQWRDSIDKNWKKSIYVALYPINADGSVAAEKTIQALKQDDFLESQNYLAEQSKRYGVALYHPFELRLGQTVKSLPPLPPKPAGLLNTVIWSLKFRWWAWFNSPNQLKTGEKMVKPDVRLYLLFNDPATHTVLGHSTALSKGRVGLVNLFATADYLSQDQVVMTHELLHTFDATDKYSFADNMPMFPSGFAEPDKLPLFPQIQAELMAGRVPVSESKAIIPKDLSFTVIGTKTAQEIGWLKSHTSE